MGWRGRSGGPWPGRGPFSYLPPWQRPGWLYGRGACWWLLAPHLQETVPKVLPSTVSSIPIPPTVPLVSKFTKEQEKQMLEQQVKALEMQLDSVRKRLKELTKEE